jgi:hypothetical protein
VVFVLQNCWLRTWDAAKRDMHMLLCWLALQICACICDMVKDPDRDKRGRHTKFANIEYYAGVFCYRLMQARHATIDVTLEQFLMLYFYELRRYPENKERRRVIELLLQRNYKVMIDSSQRRLFESVIEWLVAFYKEWVDQYIVPVILQTPGAPAAATAFFPSDSDLTFADQCCVSVRGYNASGYVGALGIEFMLSRFNVSAAWLAADFTKCVNKVYDRFAYLEVKRMFEFNKRGSMDDAAEEWKDARRMGARQQKTPCAALRALDQLHALGGTFDLIHRG